MTSCKGLFSLSYFLTLCGLLHHARDYYRRDHHSPTHLPLSRSINHVTRTLETLLTHPESSKDFVAQGGLELLLKLHSLPNLSYTFAFSSASHPLLAVVRSLTPHHAVALSEKMRDVMIKQLDQSLSIVKVCVDVWP